MTKIVVIGSSGSGKTTIADSISREQNLKYVSMDDIIFASGDFENKPPSETYTKRIFDEVKNIENWVVEGVYPKVANIIWPAADVIIWLDLPFEEVRRRYDNRDKKRSRSGPFSDIEIHKKEYARLKREYNKSIQKLQLKNVLRITQPDDDVTKALKNFLV